MLTMLESIPMARLLLVGRPMPNGTQVLYRSSFALARAAGSTV